MTFYPSFAFLGINDDPDGRVDGSCPEVGPPSSQVMNRVAVGEKCNQGNVKQYVVMKDQNNKLYKEEKCVQKQSSAKCNKGNTPTTVYEKGRYKKNWKEKTVCTQYINPPDGPPPKRQDHSPGRPPQKKNSSSNAVDCATLGECICWPIKCIVAGLGGGGN